MSAKIIQIAQLQQQYSGSYAFTTTHEPDPDFRKFLARQLREVAPGLDERIPAEAQPLDISLGDVVAGLSAVTVRETLLIDMLWVGGPLRGRGIGRRLMQMAEEAATERGCTRVRVRATANVAFFVGMYFTISGTVQALPFRKGDAPAHAVYWMEKKLT